MLVYWRVLGLEDVFFSKIVRTLADGERPEAFSRQVKDAYRKLVLIHHPDKKAARLDAHMSSVQNRCWLMSLYGDIPPNILGIILIQQRNPYKPTSITE